VDVEVTTATGAHTYPITVSKAEEVFSFPADGTPLMVLFDKGGHVLKSAEFHKDKKEWLYQAKNASEFADRADAVEELGEIKDDPAVDAALGDVLRHDKAWGLRATAADVLGARGTPAAGKQLLDSLDGASEPWVRNRIAAALGNVKNNPEVISSLETLAREDKSFRTRAAALEAIGKQKAPGALATLEAAVRADSPDGFLRSAALRAMGPLGDNQAVPTLKEWVVPGKPVETRRAAISSLARLDKDDPAITRELAGFLSEPDFPVRMSAIYALGERGDAAAVPALVALLDSKDLSIEMAPMIKQQIARLKNGPPRKPAAAVAGDSGTGDPELAKRLDRMEKLIEQMNARLKSIEDRLPAKN
jgi:HEAT repeat protein